MLHHNLTLSHQGDSSSSAHWAIGANSSCVLVQVGDGKTETRVKLTPEEAIDMSRTLLTLCSNILRAQAIECGR